MSQKNPIYKACFYAITTRTGEYRVSESSFVAFRFSVSDLLDTPNPTVSITVHITGTNMLGNTLGRIGLYEMTDSNWNAIDTYDSVDEKVSVSPLVVSDPVEDEECDGVADEPDVVFEIPSNVVRRWKRSHVPMISLAIAPYGDFEYNGYMTIGTKADEDIKIDIETGEQPVEEPFDVVVKPSTLVPTTRATITIANPDRSFTSDVADLVVTLDGESVNIVSGNEKSLKIVVPELYGKIEGMAELVVLDVDGNVLSNPCRVYYDASATKRNRYFSDPERPGRDNEKVSHSAVYNRDLGFNNFVEITDENSLVQNIYNILLTRKGERLFNPEFGTTIEERVFNLINEDDETNILQECFTAIREYEPRVAVDYDASTVEIDYDGNTIRIIIAVVLPNGNTEYITLPFKTRGNLVK